MRHKQNLSTKEKIHAWPDLCDFSFRLMKSNLTSKQLSEKIEKIREEHKKKNHRILKGLAKLA